MTNKEFFAASWLRDSKVTAKAFRSLPNDMDKLNTHHHPKFRSPWEIVNHIGPHGREVCQAITEGKADLVNEGRFDLNGSSIYKGLEEAAQDVESAAIRLAELAKSCDDNTWMTKMIPVYWNGNKIFEVVLMEFAWIMYHDNIHHRGQLSSYYRNIGVAQPNLFGPTTEEEEAMFAKASEAQPA